MTTLSKFIVINYGKHTKDCRGYSCCGGRIKAINAGIIRREKALVLGYFGQYLKSIKYQHPASQTAKALSCCIMEVVNEQQFSVIHSCFFSLFLHSQPFRCLLQRSILTAIELLYGWGGVRLTPNI